MIYPLFREAKVVSLEDPEELGRVQLKVLPELNKIEESELPWCFPASSGITGGEYGLPPKDSLIQCIVWNKFWTEISFLPFVINPPKESLFKKWEEASSEIADLETSPTAQGLKATQFADGSSVFHDDENGQHGFLHSSGTYILFGSDGSLFINGTNKLVVHDKDENFNTEINMSTGEVTIENKGDITVKGEGDFIIENKGEITLTSDGNVTIESSKNVDIEGKAAVNIKASTSCTIEATAEVSVKAAQCIVDAPIFNFKGLKSQGTVPPTGVGVFCGLPACLATGSPHVG